VKNKLLLVLPEGAAVGILVLVAAVAAALPAGVTRVNREPLSAVCETEPVNVLAALALLIEVAAPGRVKRLGATGGAGLAAEAGKGAMEPGPTRLSAINKQVRARLCTLAKFDADLDSIPLIKTSIQQS
jgi:hypothetical protein